MSKSTDVEILHHGAGRFGLTGTVNFDNAGQVMAEGQRRFARHDDVVVDTSAAEVSNTAGLAVLMEWASWCNIRDIGLRYDGLHANALAVAELNGVTMMLPVFTSADSRNNSDSLARCSR